MRFGRVRVLNFRTYKNATLDFAAIKQATFTGDNGAGKSTLAVDAPLWCLFGKAHADLDSVIGNFDDTTRVDLEVFVGDERLVVTRTRKRGGTSGLSVRKPSDEPNVEAQAVTSGVNESQAFIDSHIMNGRSYRELVASVYMVQGQHSAFTTATQAEAKEIFVNLLALDRWLDRSVKIGERRLVAEKDVSRVQGALSVLGGSEEIDEARLAQLEFVYADTKRDLDECFTQLTVARSILGSAHKENESHRSAEAEVERRSEQVGMASAKVATTRDAAFASPRIENVTLKSADETIAAQTKLREEYEAHSRRFSTLANTIEHREDDIERLTRDLSAAERNLQLVNDDMPTCYACGQELHDKAMKQALDTATKKLKTVKNELAIATLAQEEDVLSLEALNNETPEYDSHLLESAVSTRDLLVRQEELDNEHIRALDALKVADEELRNAKDRLARCKFVEVGQQEQVVTELEARYSWLTESVTNMGEELNGLRVAKAVAEASRAQRDELMASLDTYSENLVMLSFAEKAFGRDGIPAYLMDAALPAVEDTANELLSLMSEGTLSVRLATQRQTKSVGLKDALDIIVDDGTAERPFSTYSGGEGFRINFALRVALAEMVAQRSGLDLSMLVIDEPEGLDSSGRTALVQALTVIESRFDTIILVSHHEDLREALPQQVVVSKSPEGSRVKVSE